MLPLALAAEMHTKPVFPGRTRRKMTINFIHDTSGCIGHGSCSLEFTAGIFSLSVDLRFSRATEVLCTYL